MISLLVQSLKYNAAKNFWIATLMMDLDLCVRVKESQEGYDDEGKKNLAEVQGENPSGHMLHPAYSMS